MLVLLYSLMGDYNASAWLESCFLFNLSEQIYPNLYSNFHWSQSYLIYPEQGPVRTRIWLPKQNF